jgi:hypothetical protein
MFLQTGGILVENSKKSNHKTMAQSENPLNRKTAKTMV